MMEFKPVPGYDPDDFRSHSNFSSMMRRWHPLVLSAFIILTQFEWMPVWFTTSAQIAIITVAVLTFSGLCVAVFGLKILSIPQDDGYKNPLLDGSNLLELSCIFVVCAMVYIVHWPITFLIYASVNLLVVTMHVSLLIKQICQKKG